jgi:hypothetical protein
MSSSAASNHPGSPSSSSARFTASSGPVSAAPASSADLYSAAAELGEVAGWLLYDACKHDLVRRINHEALNRSRLAGDRSMELLILQNMSMHAGHLERPVEVLRRDSVVTPARTSSTAAGAATPSAHANRNAAGNVFDRNGAGPTPREPQYAYS